MAKAPEAQLRRLMSRAAACTACPGMGCRPVLSAANGLSSARVMFVGEAPGRLGAGRTGLPFSGDTAGARFERLLTEAGLTRDDIFVTNATLCLRSMCAAATPAVRRRNRSLQRLARRDHRGGEARPGGRHGRRCADRSRPHPTARAHPPGAPADVVPWRGAGLTALYHPGARAQVHRPWPHQVNDWRALGTFVRAGKDNSKNPGKNFPGGG